MENTVTSGETLHWNRYKVILLGGRNVGKSSLCSSMLVTPNVGLEPNVGLTQLTNKVRTVIAENGRWTGATTTATELEACISDNELNLLLVDLEGQHVFHRTHEPFLASYGVYIVVFNMLDILNDTTTSQVVTEISFWINTIVSRTFRGNTREMAPMFLVGTHGDIISDPLRIKYISDIIEENFKYNAGWPHIVEYNDLWFFPVNNNVIHPSNNDNNTYGELDDGIGNLKSEIERVIRDSKCRKEPKPLAWFQAID